MQINPAVGKKNEQELGADRLLGPEKGRYARTK